MAGVSQTNSSNTADADGVSTVFNFTFFAYSLATIKVYSVLDDVLTPITTGITKVIDSDNLGGTVTFSVAPADAVGAILIRREVPYTQTTEFANITRYKEVAIEAALNTLVLEIQQLANDLARCLKYNETAGVTDPTLETPEEDSVLVFGSDGRVYAGATVAEIEAAAANAAAAAASAIAAAASAAAAASSASAASTSASNASTSATNASNSANAAAASAVLAASYASATMGFGYNYLTDTANSDPSSGNLKFNNATLASATALYISETTALAQAIAAEIATWDDSTSAIHGKLKMTKLADPSVYAIFNVTGTNTDNGAWDTLTVAHVAGNGSFANTDAVALQYYRTGDKGDTGAAGSILSANGGGTVDAITADFSPDLTLGNDPVIVVVSTGPNTLTNPTLSTDGTPARTIVKGGGSALVAGDTGAAGYPMILKYSTANTRWELMNPYVIAAQTSGTFTPTGVGTSTAGAGTYTNQIGNWIRTGDDVLVDGFVSWSAHTGTGNLRLGGLPFTIKSGNYATFAPLVDALTYTANNTIIGYGVGGTTQAQLYQNVPSASFANVAIDTACGIYFSFSYRV